MRLRNEAQGDCTYNYQLENNTNHLILSYCYSFIFLRFSFPCSPFYDAILNFFTCLHITIRANNNNLNGHSYSFATPVSVFPSQPSSFTQFPLYPHFTSYHLPPSYLISYRLSSSLPNFTFTHFSSLSNIRFSLPSVTPFTPLTLLTLHGTLKRRCSAGLI